MSPTDLYSGCSTTTSHFSHLQLCPSSTTFLRHWLEWAGYEILSDLTTATTPLRLK